MPIVYVHGVANRMDGKDYLPAWVALQKYLKRYIAPVISGNPDQVPIWDAYWGDLAARFAWGGISRPRSPLLGQGPQGSDSAAARAIMLAAAPPAIRELESAPRSPPASSGGLIPAGPNPSGSAPPSFRLKDISAEELSELLVAEVENSEGEIDRTFAAIAADTVARASTTREGLQQCATSNEELALLEKLIQAEYEREVGLIGQGPKDFFGRFRDRLSETVSRADEAPGFLISRLMAEWRKPLNDLATVFVGDVFTYLRERDQTESESIPTRVMSKIAEAQERAPKEPLVVLSHSMGGQIVYDLVTHYLPASQKFKHLRIDFWCATASQVGLFAELRLFSLSPAGVGTPPKNKLPFPPVEHLGGWWNVWDHNDFISYTAQDIVTGLDDQSFNSGMSLVAAHGGYLQRPSFFREFASKLSQAKRNNWRRA